VQTTLRHGTLSVARSLERDYDLARTYLCRVPRERAIFARLEHAPHGRRYRLLNDRRGNDRFEPATNTIYWDPYSALRTTRGELQSPALGLGHEADHAVETPSRERALARTANARYDTAEECRVIRGSERIAARALREGVRFDHRGHTYRVATPVSR